VLFLGPVLGATAGSAEVRDRPDGARRFADAGTKATFVLYDLRHDRQQVSDPQRAATRFVPASTFKIPTSLVLAFRARP